MFASLFVPLPVILTLAYTLTLLDGRGNKAVK